VVTVEISQWGKSGDCIIYFDAHSDTYSGFDYWPQPLFRISTANGKTIIKVDPPAIRGSNGFIYFCLCPSHFLPINIGKGVENSIKASFLNVPEIYWKVPPNYLSDLRTSSLNCHCIDSLEGIIEKISPYPIRQLHIDGDCLSFNAILGILKEAGEEYLGSSLSKILKGFKEKRRSPFFDGAFGMTSKEEIEEAFRILKAKNLGIFEGLNYSILKNVGILGDSVLVLSFLVIMNWFIELYRKQVGGKSATVILVPAMFFKSSYRDMENYPFVERWRRRDKLWTDLVSGAVQQTNLRADIVVLESFSSLEEILNIKEEVRSKIKKGEKVIVISPTHSAAALMLPTLIIEPEIEEKRDSYASLASY